MSLTIREEKILEAAIAGEQSPIEPVTRREAIFTKATGADIELPPARNKEEDILSQLAVGYAGGGSGDFSTAQVTIVSNSAWNGSIYGAWMTDDTTIPQIQAESYGTVTGTLILKDGYADLWTMGDVDPVSVSENAEMMEYGWIQVTGDCTITYN